jgi:hypothetical protein
MKWMEIDRVTAQRRFAVLEETGEFEPATLTSDYAQIRHTLLSALPEPPATKTARGRYDVEAGLALYRVLACRGFGLRQASADGFWRHLSLEVLPDVVAARWEDHQPARFWSSRSRMWLRVVWWFIHLSWQGSEQDTRDILTGITTDDIVQLVERPGRHGFRVGLYRAIMRARSARRSHAAGTERFRELMTLNTVKVVVTEPELHEKGLDGYVGGLYAALTSSDRMARRRATPFR